MFKQQLFAINNEYYNYNTRQSKNLLTLIGNRELVYNLFSLHGINIWNYLSPKNSSDVSYACLNNWLKNTYNSMISHIEYLD